jgi:acetoin utilization protein AcuB
MDDAIENFMTQSVHTIAAGRTLADAHEQMRRLKIRHLRVLDAGRLIGIVTQRDLSLVESLKGVDPKEVTVDDAMSDEVFAVDPETPLAEVAQTMAHKKIGSAVVMRGEKVVGIFTGVDALRALDFLLTSPSVKHGLHEAMIPAVRAERS